MNIAYHRKNHDECFNSDMENEAVDIYFRKIPSHVILNVLISPIRFAILTASIQNARFPTALEITL